MWVTKDVNIPRPLLDAAEEDKVVFFVGAGASFNPPSNLPSYEQLATRLAREADKPLPRDNEQLDRFIGMLPDNFNVHKRTKAIMEGDDSHCNSTHEAIARLASSLKTPRVVTTNYDCLLEEAAGKLECDLGRNYCGPAVPIGSDFSGLLHLHGSLDSPDNEIVLNDRDFAQAYLSEGWATRFLLKLFETYTVVFIGYSFNDVIMRYLALGISSHARPRYIFLTKKEAEENAGEWRHNGITPIAYPAENNHQALVIALNAWADRLFLNYNAYEKRLPSIIENGVPKNPSDPEAAVNLDYVRGALSTDEGTRSFIDILEQEERRIETAEKEEELKRRKEEWLFWLLGEDCFRIIFTEREPKNPNEKILLNWFITDFVEKPEERDCVLRVLCELQPSMSDYLFGALSLTVSLGIRKGRKDLVPVFTILSTSMQHHSAPYVYEKYCGSLSLCKPTIPQNLLFLIIRPYLRLTPSFWKKDGKPTADIMWTCDSSVKITDGNDFESKAIVAFAEDSLQKASALLCSYQERHENSHLDRPSIEPSDQNWRSSDLTSTFVDILRDYAHHHPEQEDELIQRWWNSGSALLERLAINTIAFSRWDVDRKINWVLDQNYLFDSDAHHEVYTLLREAAPHMGQVVKKKLLSYLKEKYGFLLGLFSDERIARYEQYDVLQWVLKYGDDWPEAQHWCDDLARENDFKPREHSDFSVYSHTGKFGSTGMSNERFIELSKDNPSEIEKKLFIKPTDQNWPDLSVDLFINQIQNVVADNPQIGFILWELVNQHKEENIAMQYLCAIIRGWGAASLDNHQESVLDLLKDFHLTSDSSYNGDEINALSYFLDEQINHGKNRISRKTVQTMSCIALQIWNNYSTAFTRFNDQQWDNDPVTYSLNCWPGKLAYFWMGRILWRYKQDPDSWNMFDDAEKNMIHHFVNDEGDFSLPVWTVLLANINMLHSLDRENTESWLPDLIKEAGTEFIWNSILPNPNLNIRLIDISFYESCLDEFKYLSHLDEYKKQSFLLQVFQIATYAELDDERRVRLLSKVVTTGDGAYTTSFMNQVVWAFEFRLDAKDKDMVWNLWLRQFIKDRHADKGRDWSEEERVAFAKLIPFLDVHLEEGMQYLSDNFPRIAGHDFNNLIMLENIDCIPRECAEALIGFYTYLFKQPDISYVLGVGELLQKLIDKFGVTEVSSLVSLVKQKRIIPDTWAPSLKREPHNGDEEGEI